MFDMKRNKETLVVGILAAVALAFLALAVYSQYEQRIDSYDKCVRIYGVNESEPPSCRTPSGKFYVKGQTNPVVNDFESCVAAGYPVMESYPRQCRTPDGRNFFEEIGNNKFEEIDKGVYLEENIRGNYLLNDEKEWSELANRMYGENKVPYVDFSKYSVIAVFSGEKPSGGYTIEITDITRDGRTIVYVNEMSPGANCGATAALTYPYHVVKVPKISGSVEYIYSSGVSWCP